jgi:hypothetical protein
VLLRIQPAEAGGNCSVVDPDPDPVGSGTF